MYDGNTHRHVKVAPVSGRKAFAQWFSRYFWYIIRDAKLFGGTRSEGVESKSVLFHFTQKFIRSDLLVVVVVLIVCL